MKKHTTFMGLYVPAIMDSEPFARILQLISEKQSLTPFKYGDCEPFRLVFNKDNIGGIAKQFIASEIFFWKGVKNLSSGSVCLQRGLGKKVANIEVFTNIEKISPREILSDLIQDLAINLKGIYGYIHYLSESEIPKLSGSGTLVANPGKPPDLMVSLRSLVNCLPNLYWANIFGPEYVKLFGGSERVRSTPAPIVKELAQDTFYIQLSENMLDFASHHAEIDKVREHAKQYLGTDCFFDQKIGMDAKYRTPNIGWKVYSRPKISMEEIIQSLKDGNIPVIDTTGGEYRNALE
jgi:hypothetical protein